MADHAELIEQLANLIDRTPRADRGFDWESRTSIGQRERIIAYGPLATVFKFIVDNTDALVVALRAQPAGVKVRPPFEFDRYINGRLMAEGVTIEKQATLEGATKVAALLASRGLNGEAPVLVLRGPEPAASAAQKYCTCPNSKTSNPCVVCGKPKLVTEEWAERKAEEEADHDPTTGQRLEPAALSKQEAGEPVAGLGSPLTEASISIITRSVRKTLRDYGHKTWDSSLPEVIAGNVDASLRLTPRSTYASPVPAEGWRSIETAPKDGTRFIGLVGKRATTVEAGKVYVLWPHQPGGPTYRDVWNEVERDAIMPCSPKAWLPLPPAPHGEGA